MTWKDLLKEVEAKKDFLNVDEFLRLKQLHNNPKFDLDAYILLEGHKLFCPNDIVFEPEEEKQLREELEKHSKVIVFDHMTKDDNSRDDMKIQVKYKGNIVTIWYLKSLFSGDKPGYACLWPKINCEYYDFEALIKDIPSVLEYSL